VSETPRTSLPQTSPEFEALLEFLKHARGFDFTGYKRSSLIRRISKRMQTLGVSGYAEYQDYLEVHPEEFAPLFNTILINVTAFFRDPPTWEVLAREVIPEYLLRPRTGHTLRFWSAACASGEEAYTLAIIMAEALGIDEFKERVKIYATDVDEEALEKARHATYTEREVAGVPSALRERYFETVNGSYAFRKDLRRQVIFGRHDLVQDAPISHVDLLMCRNTLMYFNAETQAKILARFHFALNDRGILVLGRAETLLSHSATFTPIDLKRRISMKVARPTLRDRLLLETQAGFERGPVLPEANQRAREAAFDAVPIAQIVVDADGRLLLANERARLTFGLTDVDIGRALQDLRLSYKPADLRSCIEQAYSERRPVVLKDVEWQPGLGEQRWLDVQTTPLLDAGAPVGVVVSFTDVTASRRLQKELEHANQELETAYEELQSTNEELETTNEELQSTVEELETTNEELQSTNEELETMNEELQSTNEELQTINEELRNRSDELNQVNAFMESILASLPGAVVVVDREFRILVWNSKAEELWGVRSEEAAGKNFLSLDIGLNVEPLKRPMRECLMGAAENVQLVLPATNRRGKTIDCRVTCMPLLGSTAIHGVIVMMEQLQSGGREVKEG
jgi:two-component system, chemotaxis family, CheB/CheR fusion protein